MDNQVEVEEAPIENPTDAQMTTVATLVREQLRLEKEVLAAEQALKDKKAELVAVREGTLPQAMLATGLTLTKVDGLKVELKTDHHGSYSQENAGRAFAWLEENGHGDLIKNTLTAQFGRGEDASAGEALKLIQEQFPDAKVDAKRKVEPATFGAFVREQVKGGVELPGDIFSVYTSRTVKITAPKGQTI